MSFTTLLACLLSNFITHLKNLNFNSWLLKGQNDYFLHLPLSDLISLPFWSYYLKSKQGIPLCAQPRQSYTSLPHYLLQHTLVHAPPCGWPECCESRGKSTESMWMYGWLCRSLSSVKPEGCALLWSLWPRSLLEKDRSSILLTWVRNCIPTPSATQLLLTHPHSVQLNHCSPVSVRLKSECFINPRWAMKGERTAR